MADSSFRMREDVVLVCGGHRGRQAATWQSKAKQAPAASTPQMGLLPPGPPRLVNGDTSLDGLPF